ncbi:penicillin-binding protein 1A [Desertivirga arenae]|uniref:penicillin-binding protein 1A n=1 Tax=Desertivirga arenae TaxID=2810309 RepID=UPI001A95E241|nr:transglycosylase domain-containing protein [Pedobacter sp. SYSU D00823]
MFREIRIKPLRYLVVLIYFIILSFCAIELNFLWLFGYSPTLHDIKTPNMRIASEVYTADKKLIGRYYKENRTPVEFNQISQQTINALIATEDARFFSHSGIDIRSLFSSIISTASGDKRGASTITQQLAKNLYRTRNNKRQGLVKKIPLVRTIVFKLKEWITAFKLESHYSKEEILTLYFNTVPFGSNTFGLKTAAKKYFNKDTDKLGVEQSALLVGMLKASTTYNPEYHPERALERRNVVLSQMEKYGYLSKEEYKKYSNRGLNLTLGKVEDDSQGDSYLRTAVARYLEKWCEDRGYDLYESGLKIYTTIDSKLQKYAEEAVEDQMKILQTRLNNAWSGQNPWRDSEGKEIEDFPMKAAQRLPYYSYLKTKYRNSPDSIDYYLNQPKKMKVFSWKGDQEVTFSTLDSIKYYSKILNTGMMTMDPFTGYIKVWVGGIDFDHFKFDHVDQSKRQAGSTFKPFAYLAALESGLSPCDRFVDKPVKIAYDENNQHKFWEPKNSEYYFSGQEMTLRHAMGKSVNSITAQITEQVGWDNVVKYAHECGIESDLKSVPSVSLGSNDVSVFEMVRAYGTFLNHGKKTEPILVQKITDHDGNLIEEFKAEQEQVLTEEISWLMLYMFRGGMEEPGGTSRSLWEWDLWKKGNQIGGKTGTSSDFVDGWYMGITKDLVTGIWVGCDERSVHFRSSGSGEGAHTALPIFGKFMEKVYHDPSTGYTYGPFPKPTIEITREYNCTTPETYVDTTAVDTLLTDSLMIDTMSTPASEDNQQEQQQPTTTPTTDQQAPADNTETQESTAEDGKSRREIRRDQRRQKREDEANN